ncbi:tRNA lysidine(34) synthetase TilS, partial [bacterium]|nr:tRNA lysidine(34) synthetase TilS [bacterium]
MHPFLSKLSAALPRNGLWEAPAVVAVSGGADSMALLMGLVRLALPPARLIVAHACHDLRPEAPADRDFVAALADRLGLPCTSRLLAVREDVEGRGEGPEARARRLRYEFLVDVAREHGARHVVVGHTADDQAETILHRALRGTGLAGLAGMQRSRELADGVALLRPLLHLPRMLGRSFLEAEGKCWREDATNADPAFARNFLRHEILAPA